MFLSIPNNWKSTLNAEVEKDYFRNLDAKLQSFYTNPEINIFPKKDEVFKAYENCSLNEIKVVILGQDPYTTINHAHGLCFSVQEHVKPFPKSLNNIFKELKSDLNIDTPNNGNLERWTKQGVFLLNSVLTVEESKANSHSKIGWETFTDKTIQLISEECKNVVFLLWGAKAIAKKKLIDSNKHFVLESVHPSPLSAYRGFFGCKHFSKTNKLLKDNGLEEIVW